MAKKKAGGIGYWSAVSIGIGGMVGGGIFAVLGLAVQLAHGGTPVAFLIAGIVALLTSYSYAKLSVGFPSQGGTVVFLDRAFGVDLFTGTMNNLLWISYVVMLALYSFAFGSYGATFFPQPEQAFWKHVLISAGILVPMVLNMLSAGIIGKAETYIVGIKVTILLFFVAVGFRGIDAARLAPSTWSPSIQLLAGGMIIFLAYEGFELIANAAQDVADVKKTLPKAFYSSVIFVILLYILVAMVAVGSLPVHDIVAAKDYALAEAARPFLGSFGFKLIAVAALLSTFSAVNATLYGSARLSYTIAREGELPAFLENRVWNKPVEGLVLTSLFALLLANLADLSSISMMGSAGFLLIFAAVNAANIKLAKKTESRRWLSAFGLAACLAAFGALIWETSSSSPGHLWVLAGMAGISFLVEFAYREYRGHEFKLAGKDSSG
ncbi:MAG: APC family permease [Acidobacteriota bacterium]|jgi:amino acid transporter